MTDILKQKKKTSRFDLSSIGSRRGKSGNQKFKVVDHDFFPTESKFVHLLLDNHVFTNDTWEPACGEGDISIALLDRGYNVVSSDLVDRGYGRTGRDFLTAKVARGTSIITNPPFSLFNEFVNKSSQLVDQFAMLTSLPSLAASQSRYREIFEPLPPQKLVLIIDKMRIRKSDGSQSLSMFNHIWCIWDSKMNQKKTEFVFVLGGKDYKWANH